MDKIHTPFGFIEISEPFTPTSTRKYSRLYGFTFDAMGSVIPIETEQEVIRFVIETFALSTADLASTVSSILTHLSNQGIRNRSHKKFTKRTIIGLIRSVFGGKIKEGSSYLDSLHYQAIVPWHRVQRALLRVGSFLVVDYGS